MATEPASSDPTFNVREQLARIDKMQAEIGKIQIETRLAPWTLLATGAGAGAALFAAGAAFAKLLIG